MPTILQFRRGTTAQNDNYTGSTGELTIDNDLEVVRVHDGSTAGGHALVGIAATQTLTNKTLSDFTLTGNITGNVLPSANITYDLGSASQRWNDLYLANSTIYLGAAEISANATAVTITNPGGGTFALSGADAALDLEKLDASGNINLLATAPLRYFDTDSSNFVAFQAPGTISANVTWTLPDADAAGSGYSLVSNGAGGLSFAQTGAIISQDESTNTNFNIYFDSTTSGALTAAKYDTGLSYNPSTGRLTAAQLSGTLQTAAQTNVTSLGTLTGLTLSGTLTGTTINAATIGNSGATLTGTIQTASQPNITGVGTITAGTWQGSTIAVAYGGTGATTSTGSGAVVLATTPTLTTPILGTPTSGTLTNCTGLPIVGGTTGTLSVARGGTGVTTSTGSGAVVLSTSPSFSTQITTPVIAKSGTNGVGDIGQSGNKYATIYATTFSGEASSALYADLAEKYVADRYYEPGTVMVFGGEQEVTESMLDYETAVAGVVSTKPAYLMNSEQQGEFVVDIALVGRVPCKVMGPVFKGSVLVTSEHAGVAMAIDNTKFIPGCIIGRAMEDHREEGIIKIIEVSVGRS